MHRSQVAPFELKDHHQIPLGSSNARIVSIAASPTGEHVTAMSSVGETYLLYPTTCHDEAGVDQIVGEMHLDDRVRPFTSLGTQELPVLLQCSCRYKSYCLM